MLQHVSRYGTPDLMSRNVITQPSLYDRLTPYLSLSQCEIYQSRIRIHCLKILAVLKLKCSDLHFDTVYLSTHLN